MIVKYCGVGEGGIGGGGERQKPIKIMSPLLSVIKIVKYCGVGGGRGHWEGTKILQKIMAPSLFIIKIVKYCGQKYYAYKQYNCILPVTN